jgi:uncharacterized protein
MSTAAEFLSSMHLPLDTTLLQSSMLNWVKQIKDKAILMKILITGATGFVGKRLTQDLTSRGHQVIVTTRNASKAKQGSQNSVEFVEWKAPHQDFPAAALSGVNAVINLMGENIASKRWSDSQKLKLRESRIVGTKKLVEAINSHGQNVQVFLSTSAIGYYPVNTQQKMNESTEPGESFLAALCVDWEKATEGLATHIRKFIVRVGVVLGPEGGALSKLMPLFKLGLGGPIGNGSMVMSWIHINDLVAIYSEALIDERYSGVANGVAPKTVTNKEFTKALANGVKRPALFPAPPFALKLAMGELSTIVLDSQDIDCEKLKSLNFTFRYPTIEKAFQDICR